MASQTVLIHSLLLGNHFWTSLCGTRLILAGRKMYSVPSTFLFTAFLKTNYKRGNRFMNYFSLNMPCFFFGLFSAFYLHFLKFFFMCFICYENINHKNIYIKRCHILLHVFLKLCTSNWLEAL